MNKALTVFFILLTVTDQAQNVGIGTTTPTEKLEVNGRIKSTNSGYGLAHSLYGVIIGTFIHDNGGGWIGNRSNHPLIFFTNESYPLITLTTTGNLGNGLGNQQWLSKKLDVALCRNGDPIPQATDPTAWAGLTKGARCYYNNYSTLGNTYGKLYNWFSVTD
jgi:hypothetical protein